MSNKEENLPRHQDIKAASRKKKMGKREDATEKVSASPPTEKASETPPEHKRTGRGSSPGGNHRDLRKTFIWVVVLILLFIGNAYYTHFLVAKEHEARQALAEKLTTRMDTRVEEHVSAQINEQLAELPPKKDPLYQDITRLKETVGEHTQKLQAIAGLKEKVGRHTHKIQDITALNRQIDEQTEAIKAIRQEIEVLESTLQSLRAQTRRGSEPEDWKIAEAAYLIRIANERLYLGQNVNTAIIALQTADEIFQKMGNPAFAPVRAKLAEEISALKAVPLPDIDNMAASLTHLVKQVKELELAQSALEESTKATEAEKAAEQKQQEDSLMARAEELWGSVLDDLGELVIVQRRSEGEEGIPLLPPEKRYFLYQNLRMELEGARLSLLRGNEESFQQSLQLAQRWLQTYFQGAQTEAMKEALAKLAQTPINPALPDISGSLETLHRVLQHTKVQAAEDDKGGKA